MNNHCSKMKIIWIFALICITESLAKPMDEPINTLETIDASIDTKTDIDEMERHITKRLATLTSFSSLIPINFSNQLGFSSILTRFASMASIFGYDTSNLLKLANLYNSAFAKDHLLYKRRVLKLIMRTTNFMMGYLPAEPAQMNQQMEQLNRLVYAKQNPSLTVNLSTDDGLEDGPVDYTRYTTEKVVPQRSSSLVNEESENSVKLPSTSERITKQIPEQLLATARPPIVTQRSIGSFKLYAPPQNELIIKKESEIDNEVVTQRSIGSFKLFETPTNPEVPNELIRKARRTTIDANLGWGVNNYKPNVQIAFKPQYEITTRPNYRFKVVPNKVIDLERRDKHLDLFFKVTNPRSYDEIAVEDYSHNFEHRVKRDAFESTGISEINKDVETKLDSIETEIILDSIDFDKSKLETVKEVTGNEYSNHDVTNLNADIMKNESKPINQQSDIYGPNLMQEIRKELEDIQEEAVKRMSEIEKHDLNNKDERSFKVLQNEEASIKEVYTRSTSFKEVPYIITTNSKTISQTEKGVDKLGEYTVIKIEEPKHNIEDNLAIKVDEKVNVIDLKNDSSEEVTEFASITDSEVSPTDTFINVNPVADTTTEVIFSTKNMDAATTDTSSNVPTYDASTEINITNSSVSATKSDIIEDTIYEKITATEVNNHDSTKAENYISSIEERFSTALNNINNAASTISSPIIYNVDEVKKDDSISEILNYSNVKPVSTEFIVYTDSTIDVITELYTTKNEIAVSSESTTDLNEISVSTESKTHIKELIDASTELPIDTTNSTPTESLHYVSTELIQNPTNEIASTGSVSASTELPIDILTNFTPTETFVSTEIIQNSSNKIASTESLIATEMYTTQDHHSNAQYHHSTAQNHHFIAKGTVEINKLADSIEIIKNTTTPNSLQEITSDAHASTEADNIASTIYMEVTTTKNDASTDSITTSPNIIEDASTENINKLTDNGTIVNSDIIVDVIGKQTIEMTTETISSKQIVNTIATESNNVITTKLEELQNTGDEINIFTTQDTGPFNSQNMTEISVESDDPIVIFPNAEVVSIVYAQNSTDIETNKAYNADTKEYNSIITETNSERVEEIPNNLNGQILDEFSRDSHEQDISHIEVIDGLESVKNGSDFTQTSGDLDAPLHVILDVIDQGSPQEDLQSVEDDALEAAASQTVSESIVQDKSSSKKLRNRIVGSPTISDNSNKNVPNIDVSMPSILRNFAHADNKKMMRRIISNINKQGNMIIVGDAAHHRYVLVNIHKRLYDPEVRKKRFLGTGHFADVISRFQQISPSFQGFSGIEHQGRPIFHYQEPVWPQQNIWVNNNEAKNTWVPNTNPQNTWTPNTNAQNTWAPNSNAQNTWRPNTNAQSTWAPNTNSQNTWAPNNNAQNTLVPNNEQSNTETEKETKTEKVMEKDNFNILPWFDRKVIFSETTATESSDTFKNLPNFDFKPFNTDATDDQSDYKDFKNLPFYNSKTDFKLTDDNTKNTQQNLLNPLDQDVLAESIPNTDYNSFKTDSTDDQSNYKDFKNLPFFDSKTDFKLTNDYSKNTQQNVLNLLDQDVLADSIPSFVNVPNSYPDYTSILRNKSAEEQAYPEFNLNKNFNEAKTVGLNENVGSLGQANLPIFEKRTMFNSKISLTLPDLPNTEFNIQAIRSNENVHEGSQVTIQDTKNTLTSNEATFLSSKNDEAVIVTSENTLNGNTITTNPKIPTLNNQEAYMLSKIYEAKIFELLNSKLHQKNLKVPTLSDMEAMELSQKHAAQILAQINAVLPPDQHLTELNVFDINAGSKDIENHIEQLRNLVKVKDRTLDARISAKSNVITTLTDNEALNIIQEQAIRTLKEINSQLPKNEQIKALRVFDVYNNKEYEITHEIDSSKHDGNADALTNREAMLLIQQQSSHLVQEINSKLPENQKIDGLKIYEITEPYQTSGGFRKIDKMDIKSADFISKKGDNIGVGIDIRFNLDGADQKLNSFATKSTNEINLNGLAEKVEAFQTKVFTENEAYEPSFLPVDQKLNSFDAKSTTDQINLKALAEKVEAFQTKVFTENEAYEPSFLPIDQKLNSFDAKSTTDQINLKALAEKVEAFQTKVFTENEAYKPSFLPVDQKLNSFDAKSTTDQINLKALAEKVDVFQTKVFTENEAYEPSFLPVDKKLNSFDAKSTTDQINLKALAEKVEAFQTKVFTENEAYKPSILPVDQKLNSFDAKGTTDQINLKALAEKVEAFQTKVFTENEAYEPSFLPVDKKLNSFDAKSTTDQINLKALAQKVDLFQTKVFTENEAYEPSFLPVDKKMISFDAKSTTDQINLKALGEKVDVFQTKVFTENEAYEPSFLPVDKKLNSFVAKSTTDQINLEALAEKVDVFQTKVFTENEAYEPSFLPVNQKLNSFDAKSTTDQTNLKALADKVDVFQTKVFTENEAYEPSFLPVDKKLNSFDAKSTTDQINLKALAEKVDVFQTKVFTENEAYEPSFLPVDKKLNSFDAKSTTDQINLKTLADKVDVKSTSDQINLKALAEKVDVFQTKVFTQNEAYEPSFLPVDQKLNSFDSKSTNDQINLKALAEKVDEKSTTDQINLKGLTEKVDVFQTKVFTQNEAYEPSFLPVDQKLNSFDAKSTNDQNNLKALAEKVDVKSTTDQINLKALAEKVDVFQTKVFTENEAYEPSFLPVDQKLNSFGAKSTNDQINLKALAEKVDVFQTKVFTENEPYEPSFLPVDQKLNSFDAKSTTDQINLKTLAEKVDVFQTKVFTENEAYEPSSLPVDQKQSSFNSTSTTTFVTVTPVILQSLDSRLASLDQTIDSLDSITDSLTKDKELINGITNEALKDKVDAFRPIVFTENESYEPKSLPVNQEVSTFHSKPINLSQIPTNIIDSLRTSNDEFNKTPKKATGIKFVTVTPIIFKSLDPILGTIDTTKVGKSNSEANDSKISYPDIYGPPHAAIKDILNAKEQVDSKLVSTIKTESPKNSHTNVNVVSKISNSDPPADIAPFISNYVILNPTASQTIYADIAKTIKEEAEKSAAKEAMTQAVPGMLYTSDFYVPLSVTNAPNLIDPMIDDLNNGGNSKVIKGQPLRGDQGAFAKRES